MKTTQFAADQVIQLYMYLKGVQGLNSCNMACILVVQSTFSAENVMMMTMTMMMTVSSNTAGNYIIL